MKSKIKELNSDKFLAAAIAILICLFVSSLEINAQTNRRRTIKPVAAPTPTSSSNIPAVISRANDYLTPDQIIEPETPPVETAATLDEKVDKFNTRLKEMNSRLKSLESTQKNEYDEKQKRLLLNLDILTRAEQRAESLRKQLYELIEKENSVKTRIEQVDYNLRPEMIERSAAYAGSLRPEEIRDQNKKTLEVEKEKLEVLLAQIQTNRANLEENVRKADSMVEKVRARAEKDIDDALTDEKPEDN